MLGIGSRFFNLFNHPNFDQPVNDVEVGRLFRHDSVDGLDTDQHSGCVLGRRCFTENYPVEGLVYLLN